MLDVTPTLVELAVGTDVKVICAETLPTMRNRHNPVNVDTNTIGEFIFNGLNMSMV